MGKAKLLTFSLDPQKWYRTDIGKISSNLEIGKINMAFLVRSREDCNYVRIKEHLGGTKYKLCRSRTNMQNRLLTIRCVEAL